MMVWRLMEEVLLGCGMGCCDGEGAVVIERRLFCCVWVVVMERRLL